MNGKGKRMLSLSLNEGGISVKRLVWFIGILALIAFFVYRKWDEVWSVAVVLTYMALFSVILAPICSKMERRGMRPTFAAACAVIGLFILVFVLLAAFIPYLVAQSVQLIKRISPIAAQVLQQLLQWAEGFGGVKVPFTDVGNMLGMVLSVLTRPLLRIGITTAQQIGRIAFSLVLTYYVLCDRKRICCHLLMFVPSQQRAAVISALLACKNAIMGYFCGLMKTSAFVAAATAVGLLIFRVKDAVLLALLMGIFEIFPYIGPILAAVPIVLSAMVQGRETAILVLVMLVGVQQIEGNIITPYFTASATSVHPLLAILGVFVVGNLFGLWGILLGVPMMVLGQSMIWSLRRGAM